MIVLFTDFGDSGLYIGQVQAALHRHAQGVPVVSLCNDLAPYRVEAAAHLLAAYHAEFASETVFLCVVDPGVGSEREALILYADGRWFVGPDNGLLDIVASRAASAVCWKILWQPEQLSASFHGRDLFAPVAAKLAKGSNVEAESCAYPFRLDSVLPLAEVIYIDHYGNCLTGLPAGELSRGDTITVGEYSLNYARTFSEVERGAGFWYENANALIELAVNQGSAAERMRLQVGEELELW